MTIAAPDAPPPTDAAAPPSISRRRRAITSIVLSILLLYLGGHAFRFFMSMGEASAKAPGQQLPEVVRVQKAERAPYTETLSGFGKARALRQITVAAEVVGRVDWVSNALEPGAPIDFELPHAQEGETPREDEPPPGPAVVRLNPRDLENQVERAAADVAGVETEIARLATVKGNVNERLVLAQQELDAATREWDRIEKLVNTKRLPRGDLDRERLSLLLRERAVVDLESQLRENEDAIATLGARLDARTGDLHLAQRNLTRASIHVPAPGIVQTRSVNVGDRVALGAVLFTVLDLSRIEIPVALPARRYADVRAGSAAVVHDADTGVELWRGAVARVAPEINERDRTFFVYLVVDGKPTANPVPPGTHVLAEIEGKTHPDVVVVPREAFVGGVLYVVAPDPDAPSDTPDRYVVAARRTPDVVRLLTAVAIIRAGDGDRGIDDGEEYVVTNLESVADGSRLRVAPDVARGIAVTPDGR